MFLLRRTKPSFLALPVPSLLSPFLSSPSLSCVSSVISRDLCWPGSFFRPRFDRSHANNVDIASLAHTTHRLFEPFYSFLALSLSLASSHLTPHYHLPSHSPPHPGRLLLRSIFVSHDPPCRATLAFLPASPSLSPSSLFSLPVSPKSHHWISFVCRPGSPGAWHWASLYSLCCLSSLSSLSSVSSSLPFPSQTLSSSYSFALFVLASSLLRLLAFSPFHIHSTSIHPSMVSRPPCLVLSTSISTYAHHDRDLFGASQSTHRMDRQR